MPTAHSPRTFPMSSNDAFDPRDNWVSWRASAPNTDLPTPPSSVPPKRSKPLLFNHFAAQAPCYSQEHLTLPPITHIDRHWPCSSPLTPPDDEMHSSPLWREDNSARSRLHSPFPQTSSPFISSPSPSPVDDDAVQYNLMDESCDAFEQVPNTAHGVWQHRDAAVAAECEKPYAFPEPAQHVADWVMDGSNASAHFLAEKVCEMVCYLWFSSSLGSGMAAGSRQRRERERLRSSIKSSANVNSVSPPFVNGSLSSPRTAGLQFFASPEFVAFMQKLLETTQVSRSVIVLSLHYIYRLKGHNQFTPGKPGSEFRVAVCALMLANKFVDDNTYTNKTWSEVSSIPLEELNKMEREFLLGVNFRLFVDKPTYESWLNLLQGLILAKEREFVRWQASRHLRAVPVHTATAFQRPPLDPFQSCSGQMGQSVPVACSLDRQHRARSTSPKLGRAHTYPQAFPFTFSMPSQFHVPVHTFSSGTSQSARTSPADAYSSRACAFKRTAADAFSPRSSLLANRLSKRPTGLVLDIGAALASSSSVRSDRANASLSAHPYYADSIRGLERMNLSSAPMEVSESTLEQYQQPERRDQTLAAPYRISDAAQRAVPPHLYFYALASSPVPLGDSAWTSNPDDCPQPGLSSVNGLSTVERSHAVAEASSYISAADRKARLKYSYAPDQARTYGCICNYRTDVGCSVCSRKSVVMQDGMYSQEGTYPSSSATITSNIPAAATTVSLQYTDHHQLVAPHNLQQPRNTETRQLPPLSHALSLADPMPRIPRTQSARTSPFCGYSSMQNAYSSLNSAEVGAYRPIPHATSSAVTAVQNPSWSVPTTAETINGVYVPAVPAYGVASPTSCVYGQYQPEFLLQNGSAESGKPPQAFHRPRRSVQMGPRPAAFANAGPPGVAQFYPSGYVPFVM